MMGFVMSEQPMGEEAESGMVPERLVFSHHGRFWDPVKVWRQLANHKTIDIWMEVDRVIRPLSAEECSEAFGAVAQATIDAFELEPFDGRTGNGTTEEQAFNLCKDYMNWVAEFKKKLLLLPTKWQHSVPSELSDEPSEPQNNGPSSSTTEESLSDKPPLS